ncbi:MAG: cupin [Chloroflexi bacterium]|nr:cupin [Chloroflexota bacterium]
MTTPPTFDTSGFSLEPGARRIDKPWGHEILLSPPDAPYTAKLIHVHAGHRLSLQIHDIKVETQTLMSGRGYLLLEDANAEVREVWMEPGVGYHIAVGQRHRLCAAPDSDVTVFEASTPEVGTTYRLDDDYARPHETDERRAAERRADERRDRA